VLLSRAGMTLASKFEVFTTPPEIPVRIHFRVVTTP